MRPVAAVSEAIDRDDFEAHDIPIPPKLEQATIELVRAKSGKWHARNGCQWASEGATQPIPLLGIRWSEMCSHCAKVVVRSIDPAHTAALRAVGELRAMRRHLNGFARFANSNRDFVWLDYAQWRAGCPMSPESIAALADQIRGTPGTSSTIAALHRAAVDYVRQNDELLTRLADRLSLNLEDGLLDRAIEIVNTDSPARAESELLAAITGTSAPGIRIRGLRNPHFDAWGSVADLWLAEHRHGRTDAAMITASATRQVAQHLTHVKDLTQLPVDPGVAAHPSDTPQSWADRVFATLRNRTVTTWVDRAEMALQGLQGVHRRDPSIEPERALLVTGWPLHLDSTARLAYLTQYPQLLTPVTIDFRCAHESPVEYEELGRITVAVLRVSDQAAEQAHAISSHIRSTSLADDLDPATAARRLLRDIGVLIHPTDLTHSQRPSQLVEAERHRIAAALDDPQFDRPFAPNTGGLPARLQGRDCRWTSWEARAAFNNMGSIYIPGIDDPDLFALAFSRTAVHSPAKVAVRLEITGSKPPTVPPMLGLIPEIEHVPSERSAGLLDASAALYGITDDHTALLLEISPCRETFAVPLNCVAFIQNRGR